MVNGIFELLLTTPNLNPIKGNYSNLKLQYERDLLRNDNYNNNHEI